MNTNGASTSDSAGGGGAVAPAGNRKESRKPKYSRFTQQELPACKPLLTPKWVIATFMLVGIIFIPIGAVCLRASNSVVEVVHRYETECLPAGITRKEDKVKFIQDETRPKTCSRTLVVPKKMDSPVYVYYQLDNFYQNHRRYVKSRDDSALRKDSYNPSATGPDKCKPEATFNGSSIFPCGLIAWSLFNDSYSFSSNSAPLAVNRKGISWKSDRDDKFGKARPYNFVNNLNGTVDSYRIGGKALDPNTPLNQQEDLIVWMRTAALPTFRKLYGKIETDLQEGQRINVNIQNNYNTYTFSGKKKLVLSTTSWLGGKNNFLGIAYLTVGILCIVLALLFFLIHLRNPRPLGDPSYLSWNRKTPIVSSSSGPN